MSHPTDAFDARVPVFVLTEQGEIVPEESPEGLEALAAYAQGPLPGYRGFGEQLVSPSTFR